MENSPNVKLKSIKSRLDIYSVTIISIGVLIFILLSFFAPGFFTVRNFTNILVKMSTLGFLVLGITPVIIIGQIDLSLGVIMASATIVGVSVIQKTGNVLLGIIIIIAVAIAVGAFNGLFIGMLNVVSFIVTLSVMIVGSGFAAWFTKEGSISNLPDSFRYLGTGLIGFVPVQFIIFIFFVFITHLLLNNHYIGRWIYAIGTNSNASKFCGIPIKTTILLIYIFAAFMASLSGIIQAASLNSASAAMGGQGVILDYITAAVVGGISINGGKGNTINAFIGIFLMVILINSMNLLGINYYTTLAIKGAIIIFVVALEGLRRNK